jgi:hypothetical protein
VGLALCVVALATSLVLSRASIGRGLGWVLLVGCLSGWLRCRIFDGFSHFIFDAALLGCYLQCARFHLESKSVESRVLDGWVLLLLAVPTLVLLCSPFIGGQPFLVQLVGLRSSLLFVPTLALAARMTEDDVREFSSWAGVSAVIATGFALAELAVGVEAFFPLNAATATLYRTFAVAGQTLRLPACFATSHLYGGAVVALIPILWTRLEDPSRRRDLTALYLACATSAAFLCSARIPVLLLAALVLTIITLGWKSPLVTMSAVAAVAAIWIFVGAEERFRRYETLGSEDVVAERIHWSVNNNLLDIIMDAPLGHGLASAVGTSIPYFLLDDALPQEGLESEVSRLALELGVIGLAVWILFVGRSLLAGFIAARRSGRVSDALMFVSLGVTTATALIGVGVMSAIPGTLLLFLQIGWLSRKGAELSQRRRSNTFGELAPVP